jgi:hypothetical protein
MKWVSNMKQLIPTVVFFVLATANLASAWDDPPKPKLPIGKDTTVVDGPLDKDGYIDYEAALNERLGKGITPEKNACAALWATIGPKPDGGTRGMPPEYFRALGIAEPPVESDYFIDLFKFTRNLELNEEERNDVDIEQFSRAAQRPWKAKDFPHLAAWLKANEKPLAVVIEAVKRPNYFHPLRSHRDKDPSSHLIGCTIQPASKCRELTMALLTRAMLRTGEGRFDDAWDDLISCHRMGRHLSHGTTMVEALVGIALEIQSCMVTVAFLDRADLSAKKVQACLAELRKLPPPAPLADKLDLGERFTLLDTIQLIRRGKGSFSLGASLSNFTKDIKVLNAIDWTPALKDANAWFDRLVAASREPNRMKREQLFDGIDTELKLIEKEKPDLDKLFEQLFTAMEDFQKQLDDAKKLPAEKAGRAITKVLIQMMGPAARKIQESADRAEQTRRNLELAFVLLAFKKDTGKYPTTLAELAPKYLPSVPDDLFSGKPLIYKPTENGYLLYSVGVNGKDDGGQSYGDDPPGDDLVVRMPVPERAGKK